MSYFTPSDHQAMRQVQQSPDSAPVQEAWRRMDALHSGLHQRLQQYNIALSPNPQTGQAVGVQTLTSPLPQDALSIIYTRSRAQAVTVENLMGRDSVNVSNTVRLLHHPAVEVCLSPEHLAVELVIAPTAWYDQQNFVGKLSIKQHREDFYALLEKVPGRCLMGLWGGLRPQDSHIDLSKLPPKVLLYEYLDTFAAGRDWLRFGYWYEPADDDIDAQHISATLFADIEALYQPFRFIAWTSDNNFRRFY